MKTRSDEHIKGEVLELYAINEQAAKDSQTIEDHLLICEGCRVRLVEVERFITTLKDYYWDFSERPIDYTHETDCGPIRVQVRKSARHGEWSALVYGKQLESCRSFGTVLRANESAIRSFREMFPEHKCSRQCGPTQMQQPDSM